MKKLFFFIFLFIPFLTYAGLVPCGGEGQPECEICHLFVLLQNVINFILWQVLPYLIPLMIIAAGVVMIVAYVDLNKGPEWIKRSREILKNIAIGIVLVYASWIIVNVFFQIIGVIGWQGLEAGGEWWFIEGCP